MRSPLAALQLMIGHHAPSLPEEIRRDCGYTFMRLLDIANDMLDYFDRSHDDSATLIRTILISPELSSIISEKKYEYNKKKLEFVNRIATDNCFIAINIEVKDFRRSISNIINNAVDALDNKPDGKIIIDLECIDDVVSVHISDNSSALLQLAAEESKKQNSRRVTLDIKIYNKAAMATIRCNPQLFKQILLQWLNNIREIFKETGGDKIEIELSVSLKKVMLTITDNAKAISEDLECYFNHNTALPVDNQDKHALNFTQIKQMISQCKGTYSVFNYAEEGNKINLDFPRTDISVKLIANPTTVKNVTDEKSEKHVDTVWVEDKEWFSATMVREHYQHLKVDCYGDPREFMTNLSKYPLDTIIILDTYYELDEDTVYEKTGYDIAQDLHQLGYTKLILLSGDSDVHLSYVADYLTVVLKNDNMIASKLDKINF